MSYCGHFSASPLQPPSTPSDIYLHCRHWSGDDAGKCSFEDGKGAVGTPTWTYTVQYVCVGTNPLGNKGSAMDGCGLWILIGDPNPASRS